MSSVKFYRICFSFKPRIYNLSDPNLLDRQDETVIHGRENHSGKTVIVEVKFRQGSAYRNSINGRGWFRCIKEQGLIKFSFFCGDGIVVWF